MWSAATAQPLPDAFFRDQEDCRDDTQPGPRWILQSSEEPRPTSTTRWHTYGSGRPDPPDAASPRKQATWLGVRCQSSLRDRPEPSPNVTGSEDEHDPSDLHHDFASVYPPLWVAPSHRPRQSGGTGRVAVSERGVAYLGPTKLKCCTIASAAASGSRSAMAAATRSWLPSAVRMPSIPARFSTRR